MTESTNNMDALMEHPMLHDAVTWVITNLLVGQNKYYFGLTVYFLILISVYRFGKTYRIKFSQMLDNLKKTRGAVEKIQRKVSRLENFRSWTRLAATLLLCLTLIFLVTDAYLRLPNFESWVAAISATAEEYKLVLQLSTGFTLILGIASKLLHAWIDRLSRQQVSAKSEQEGFVDRLLKTLDPEIVFALYQNVDKQNLRGEIKQSQERLQKLSEETCLKRAEISTKKKFLNAYEKFLEGIAEFGWCQDCISALNGKTEISSAQELSENGDSGHPMRKRSESRIAVCQECCLLKYQRFVKELEVKLREEADEITGLKETMVDTMRTEETQADLEEFGIERGSGTK